MRIEMDNLMMRDSILQTMGAELPSTIWTRISITSKLQEEVRMVLGLAVSGLRFPLWIKIVLMQASYCHPKANIRYFRLRTWTKTWMKTCAPNWIEQLPTLWVVRRNWKRWWACVCRREPDNAVSLSNSPLTKYSAPSCYNLTRKKRVWWAARGSHIYSHASSAKTE